MPHSVGRRINTAGRCLKLRENSEKIQLCPRQIKVRDNRKRRTYHTLFFIIYPHKTENWKEIFFVDAVFFSFL